jgi:hypothetical protein
MLSIKKQNLNTNQIKAELKKLETELLKATRELLDLEDRYRSAKMELLARIEAYEAKLTMLKSMI